MNTLVLNSLIRRLLVVVAATMVLTGAVAQSPEEAPAVTLDRASAELRPLVRQVARQQAPEARKALQERIGAIRTPLRGAAQALDADMDGVQKRLADLGPPAPTDPVELKAARGALQADLSRLQAESKRARVLDLQADEYGKRLSSERAHELDAELSEKSISPLSPTFWLRATAAAGNAIPQLGRFVASGAMNVHAAATPLTILVLAVVFGLATFVVWPVRIWLRGRGLRYASEHPVGDGRVRKSVLAFWLLVTGTVTVSAAAFLIHAGLRTAGVLTGVWEQFAQTAVAATIVGAYMVSLGQSLLLVDRPEWRFLQIETETARRFRPYSHAAALIVALSLVAHGLTNAAQLDPAFVSGIDAILAMASCALIVMILVAVGRVRSQVEETGEAASGVETRLMTGGLLLVWPFTLYIIVTGALGYVSYATKMAQWLVWGGVVIASLFLLMALVDDLCRTYLSNRNRFSRSAHARIGVRDNTIEQFGVLVSAALRIALILLAAGAIMVPFGSGLTSFFGIFSVVTQGFQVGEIRISLSAVLRAVAVLLVLLAIMRAIRHWLVRTYLPTTGLEESATNSIGVVTGYIGVALSIIWSMAAFGIGMDKLAVLVSALSVGIGFGLQAITQNFVSGLILLAERPVRIGDRIKVGDQEGRINRIRVRSTEVVGDDQTRLIVPNSELITKTIQNMPATASSKPVRVQVAVPYDEDLGRVRDLLKDELGTVNEVLAEPAAVAFIETIEAGQVIFACVTHVSASADVERVRGDLWLTLINRLRTERVPIGIPAQRLEVRRGDG